MRRGSACLMHRCALGAIPRRALSLRKIGDLHEFLVLPGAALTSLVAAAVSACGNSDDNRPDLRATQYGQIQGVNDSAGTGTYAWKGIPFAKAPVDSLRWKAPVDPEPWTTTRQATQFANACVQYGRIYGPGANNRYDETIGTTLGQSVGSED